MAEIKTQKASFQEDVAEKTKAKVTENVNEVEIQGKLVHKFVTDKATLLTVNTGRATTVPNYPKVVFFGPEKDEAAKFEVGDNVRITGNIQSSKRNPAIKNQVTLSVFGETIAPATTQFEQNFGVSGVYAAPINQFKLAGTIVSIDIPNKNLVRLTVRCVKNNRISFVQLVHFSKFPEKVIAEYLPGDFVRVLGSVQTTKQEKNGEMRYYQSYVVTELHK